MLNNNLTKEIITHIYENIGLSNGGFILSTDFLQDKTIDFEDYSGKLWACELNIDNAKIQLLAAKLSDSKDDFCFISKVDKCPVYACYIHNGASIIAFNQTNNWSICNFYFQGAYLSGMEQLKDVIKTWEKSQNIDEILSYLKSFIIYYDSLNE